MNKTAFIFSRLNIRTGMTVVYALRNNPIPAKKDQGQRKPTICIIRRNIHSSFIKRNIRSFKKND